MTFMEQQGKSEHWILNDIMGFPGRSAGKESSCTQETWVQSLDWDNPLEKEKATHSSILVWRIPWTV